PLRTRWTRRRRRRVRRNPGRRRGAVLRFEAERRRRRTALGEGRLGLRRLETGRRGFDLVRPRVGGAIDVERGERHGLAVDFDVGTHALRRLDVEPQLRHLWERGVLRGRDGRDRRKKKTQAPPRQRTHVSPVRRARNRDPLASIWPGVEELWARGPWRRPSACRALYQRASRTWDPSGARRGRA